MTPFTQQVLKIVKKIPRGRIITYGLVAAHANNKSGARQVARILHSCSDKYDLPWHRVVNAHGKISLPRGSGYEVQKELLEEEGVEFGQSGRIEFSKFLWWPKSKWRRTENEKDGY